MHTGPAASTWSSWRGWSGCSGRDRIHVVDSGDFFTEPEPVYDAVLEFLGLPQLGYPAFERHNAPAPVGDAGGAEGRAE